METGYTSSSNKSNNTNNFQSSLPRCQTTGSLTPTRNMQSDPMNNQSNNNSTAQNYVNQSKNNHYLSQQVPSSNSRKNSKSPQYNSTANNNQKFSTSGKTNINNTRVHTSSTPPGSKPQLHNLTRNHFIASTATELQKKIEKISIFKKNF